MGAAILWPVAAHLVLVVFLYAWLTYERLMTTRRGEASYADYRAREREPRRARLIANNLASQFEAPLFFHVLAMTLYVTGAATPLQVGLAWTFVAGRLAHTGVHTLSANVRARGLVFTVNFLAILAMWALFLADALRDARG